MTAYSFLDMALSISGPSGSATVGGDNTGSSEEGFSIIFEEDRDVMTQGADGSVMHSLTAAKRGRVELHLLKTSPYNAVLSQIFASDSSAGSLNWAKNTMTARNAISGDTYQITGVAIRKFADNNYQTRGNILTWVFNASVIDPTLGNLNLSP